MTNNTVDKITLEELKEKELSSFEFSRELIELETKIVPIKKSRKEEKNKELTEEIIELNEHNIKIESEKRYYNDTITAYNNLAKKFPSNIVSKISRFKQKNYFDNKDMFDEKEKDFKI